MYGERLFFLFVGIAVFFSFGFQYQGLIGGRDDDILGADCARGVFSDKASATYTDDYESVVELYYSAKLAPWLKISPNFQYVSDPGCNDTGGDAVVLGVRAQMSL